MSIFDPTRSATCVRQLTPADLPELLALQAEVSSGLPAHYIRAKTESDLRGFLNGRLGVAFGIVDRATLLATALLRLPNPEHPNSDSGPPFPLVPAADWPLHAAFLENAVVRPAARGRGYQRALLRLRLAHAAACGMKWVCAGVNLDNQRSWSNLLAEEMAIVGLIDPGFPLIGLLAAFDAASLATDSNDCIVVAAQDRVGHEAALRRGYVGLRLTPEGAVIYQLLSARTRDAA